MTWHPRHIEAEAGAWSSVFFKHYSHDSDVQPGLRTTGPDQKQQKGEDDTDQWVYPCLAQCLPYNKCYCLGYCVFLPSLVSKLSRVLVQPPLFFLMGQI